jgi:hypothetical protein
MIDMTWGNSKKEKQRYYLLAGMGGRAARRRHLMFQAWAILAGIAVSFLLALSLWLTNRH